MGVRKTWYSILAGFREKKMNNLNQCNKELLIKSGIFYYLFVQKLFSFPLLLLDVETS